MEKKKRIIELYKSVLYKNSNIYLERKFIRYKQLEELKNYNEENKKEIWTNNLGSCACKSIM